MRRIEASGGFTVMELVVAMAVTAAVLTGAFLSFRSSLDLSQEVQSRSETAFMARLALRTIRDDLLSFCRVDKDNAQEQGLKGAAEQMTFCSNSSLSLESSDFSSGPLACSYTLERRPSGSMVLVRSQTPGAGLSGKWRQSRVELCEDVLELEFSYVGDNGESSEWDSVAALAGRQAPYPRLIRVRLQIGGPGRAVEQYQMTVDVGGDA